MYIVPKEGRRQSRRNRIFFSPQLVPLATARKVETGIPSREISQLAPLGVLGPIRRITLP
eukprot:scaffold46608_cov33-Tisochrysis_lutea.AAC.4